MYAKLVPLSMREIAVPFFAPLTTDLSVTSWPLTCMPDSAIVQRDDVEGARGYLGVPETSLNCGSYSPIVMAPPDVFSLSVVRSSAKAIKFGVVGFCSKRFAIIGRAAVFLIFFSIMDSDIKPRPRIPSAPCWYVLSTFKNANNHKERSKEALIRITLILHLISSKLNSGVSDVSRGGTNSICEVKIVGCLAVDLDLLTSDPLASIQLVSNMNCKQTTAHQIAGPGIEH